MVTEGRDWSTWNVPQPREGNVHAMPLGIQWMVFLRVYATQHIVLPQKSVGLEFENSILAAHGRAAHRCQGWLWGTR